MAQIFVGGDGVPVASSMMGVILMYTTWSNSGFCVGTQILVVVEFNDVVFVWVGGNNRFVDQLTVWLVNTSSCVGSGTISGNSHVTHNCFFSSSYTYSSMIFAGTDSILFNTQNVDPGSYVVVPRSQTKQKPLPLQLLYLPISHKSQLREASFSANVPSWHNLQACEAILRGGGNRTTRRKILSGLIKDFIIRFIKKFNLLCSVGAGTAIQTQWRTKSWWILCNGTNHTVKRCLVRLSKTFWTTFTKSRRCGRRIHVFARRTSDAIINGFGSQGGGRASNRTLGTICFHWITTGFILKPPVGASKAKPTFRCGCRVGPPSFPTLFARVTVWQKREFSS